MKRRDFLFAAAVVFLIILCFLLRSVLYHGEAVYLEISRDGTMISWTRLSELEGQELRIASPDGGYNLVCIENGGVFVREADCENGDCIRQGTIHHTGESIICLPHKLTVTIVGSADSGSGDAQIYNTIVR